MRGMFTCGVLDVLMEQGIRFDGAAGISAGAVFGCNYKSMQPGRAIRYNLRFCKDPRYGSLLSWIKTGDLYEADFCYRLLPEQLDPFDRDTFAENPMEFYVGATDIRTGRAVFHRCTNGGESDLKWMQASASMPLISRPVETGNYLLLDGGISCPIPYRYMECAGYHRNLIVLTQPLGFVKKKTSALPLLRFSMKEYPALIRAMAVRHRLYNRQLEEIAKREALGHAFVIRPPKPLGISRTEKSPAELERVYRIGRETAGEKLDELKRFLDRRTLCQTTAQPFTFRR